MRGGNGNINNMTSGMIFDIKRYAINDGPGIRTAVFLKGCPLDCWWCHNPEGKSASPQLMFRDNRCKACKECLTVCPTGAISWDDGPGIDWNRCDSCGKCADSCYAGALEMVGREITVHQLVEEIRRDIPFYDQSGGGVTFTGGEPMQQREFLKQALSECKRSNIHTAVDTCGYAPWESFDALLHLVDLFLFDVKLINPDLHREYTSLPNQMILENLQKLSVAGARIIVRVPFIPGINDDLENQDAIRAFLAELPHLEQVELMPYHETGVAKYKALGMEYMLAGTQPPTDECIIEGEEYLQKSHLPVRRHISGRKT